MPIKKPRKGRYFYVVSNSAIFSWIGDDGVLRTGCAVFVGSRYWPCSKALVRDAIAANNGDVTIDSACVHQFETKTLRFVKTIKRPGEPWVYP